MSGNVYELGRVPLLSILGMAVSAIVSIGIAVAALIIIYKKTKGKLISSLIGAVTFIVLVLFIEQLLHQVLFSLFPDFFLGNRFVYAVYGGLAAAVFEEFGRLLAMGVIMKRFLTKQNSLLYGAGHGGAEAVILGGLNGISNIMFSLLINAGIMEKLLGGILSSQAPALAAQLSPLWLQPSY
ncbi:MAG: YhfC family intramembrane metalloprotease, partial [Clostridia bacterium]|nr:YhfC family intramembrane metalloprotease [Clostridia bacterium]